ncbi:MAG TPA: hypothetical protein GX699_02250 [Firmicutes bacterium]|jgi:hypothetical protein|nr:hypothetical protein [Bacillota bacterium]
MGRNNLITVLDPRGQPSGLFGRRSDGENPGTILSPRVRPSSTRDELGKLRMAERLDTLEGKLIYLVNTGFFGSKEFLEELDAWFKANIPSLTTVYKEKKNDMYSDDPELWEEIKANNADGVVIGVGG